MPSELLLLASNINEEPCLQRSIDMKPSPFSILFAALVLTAVVCAQSNSPAPKPVSCAPDAPMAVPQSSNLSKPNTPDAPPASGTAQQDSSPKASEEEAKEAKDKDKQDS